MASRLWGRHPSGSAARVQFADGNLILEGRITFDTVMDLYRETRTRLSVAQAVNLRSVTFMDSAGVALLVEWKRLASLDHRGLLFLNLPDQAKAIAGLSNALGILGLG
ncbi:Sulfate transporter/antisigma-factor antagonist STAS [mine drainage metagenome]|uniref:Sulfate transporter/antisigma-factor antagonist STAS n=1 Tax=mine drainage metagenome TaxID=410659 RepID=T1BPM5_9ZZZZ